MKKIGILGGGQLGRMLLQAAANYPVVTYVMEKDTDCPSAHLCHQFFQGDICNFDDVYRFGKQLDAITIEIENVNSDALELLEKEGVAVYPRPSALKTIKNKIEQKSFYRDNQIPTAEFVVTQSANEISRYTHLFPAVHKTGNGGYDGKGVQVLQSSEDISVAFDEPSVLEKMIQIKKEIAIIIAVGNNNETAIYPPVDMVFDNNLNLLSHQLCPAELPEKVFWKAEAIALSSVKKLASPGIFAVEMFVDSNDNVLINEIAPRVHNSGHHTIEGNYSSQFDMLWRIMLGFPLGNTELIMPTALVNLVGEINHSGEPKYDGLEKVLSMENVFVHIYGKKQTKPGRKMGHATVLSNERQELVHKANQIKHAVKIISQ